MAETRAARRPWRLAVLLGIAGALACGGALVGATALAVFGYLAGSVAPRRIVLAPGLAALASVLWTLRQTGSDPDPLVPSAGPFVDYGTPFLLVALVILGLAVGAATAIAKPRSLAVGGRSRAPWLALLLGGITVATAWTRSRDPRPPDLGAVATVAWLSAGDSARVAGRTLGLERVRSGPWLADCRLVGVKGAPVVRSRWSGAPCPLLRVRHEDRGGDWLFVTVEDGAWAPVYAFDAADGSAIALDYSMLADPLVPPFTWRIGAAVALVLALGLLVGGWRVARSARGLAGLEEVHRGAGSVVLRAGAAQLVPAAAALPAGPVVLLGEQPGRASYRDAGASAFAAALRGTLAAERAQRVTHAATLDALALAAIVAAVIPLLVARAYGF